MRDIPYNKSTKSGQKEAERKESKMFTPTNDMHPQKNDARLVLLPVGVQILRDNDIRYHFYSRITDSSRKRLWQIMQTECLQLATNKHTYMWKSRRAGKE
jgi:hypothetical protein